MTKPVTAGAPSNIQKLKDLEAKHLDDGGLSKTEAKELVDLAKTKAEKALVKQMFSHDSFEKGFDAKKAGKLLGKKTKITVSPAVGMKVGETKVLRTFGPANGFLDRSQALGIAALSKSPNAAVVKDAKGNWHAVETEAPLKGKTGDALPVRPYYDSKAITEYRKLAAKDTSGNNADTQAAAKKMAASILGIPESEINIVQGESQLDPNKVNVNINQAADGAEGRTFSQQADANGVVPNYVHVSAITQGPTHAATVLFHEGVHSSDWELQNQWKKKYQALDPKPTFQGSPASFQLWLSMQETAGKLSETDHSRMKTEHMESPRAKETHAHMQAFMAALTVDPVTAFGEVAQLGNDYPDKEKNNAKLNGTELRAWFDTLGAGEQQFVKIAMDNSKGQARAVFDAAFPDGLELAKTK